MRHFSLLFVFSFEICFALPSAADPASSYSLVCRFSIWWCLGVSCRVAEGRSGEAVHITMMLQVVEQEEVQQVQIVALLGRVVLPVDRRRR